MKENVYLFREQVLKIDIKIERGRRDTEEPTNMSLIQSLNAKMHINHAVKSPVLNCNNKYHAHTQS